MVNRMNTESRLRMFNVCPRCLSDNTISFGIISDYFRFGCLDCDYRWTELEDKVYGVPSSYV